MNRDPETITFTEYCILYGQTTFMRQYYDNLFTQVQYNSDPQPFIEECMENIKVFDDKGYNQIATDLEERLSYVFNERK